MGPTQLGDISFSAMQSAAGFLLELSKSSVYRSDDACRRMRPAGGRYRSEGSNPSRA